MPEDLERVLIEIIAMLVKPCSYLPLIITGKIHIHAEHAHYLQQIKSCIYILVLKMPTFTLHVSALKEVQSLLLGKVGIHKLSNHKN